MTHSQLPVALLRHSINAVVWSASE